MVVYRQPDFGQGGEIVAFEGVQVVGAHLGGAVATPQIVLKQYGHLLHHRLAVDGVDGSGNLQCGYQVFFPVGSHLTYRKLRACDYHRLVQVLEHKRQCRCRVGHRIGAVEHYEAVEVVVTLANLRCNLLPMGWVDVT